MATTNPKFLHIVKGRHGYMGSTALCGRMVNRMGFTSPEQATCTKCLAEHLAKTTQQPAGL